MSLGTRACLPHSKTTRDDALLLESDTMLLYQSLLCHAAKW